MINTNAWIMTARKGGDVERYHNLPNLIKTQSNAHHSYNGAIMIHCLGNALNDLYSETKIDINRAVVTFLMHDIPEIGIGDVPGPVKSKSPELKHELRMLELDWCEDYVPDYLKGDMFATDATYAEKFLVKFVDQLEPLFKMIDELKMGNKSVQPTIDAIIKGCKKMLKDEFDVRGEGGVAVAISYRMSHLLETTIEDLEQIIKEEYER